MRKYCNSCGSKNLKEKPAQYLHKYRGKVFVVNNVPCEECGDCGERYFQAEALKNIEKKFNDTRFAKDLIGRKSMSEVTLPREEFEEI